MQAYTGYWNSMQYLIEARRRIEAERKRAREKRVAHRMLPRWERLLEDFAALDKKLRREVNRGSKCDLAVAKRLLKQRNRIADLLNKYDKREL